MPALKKIPLLSGMTWVKRFTKGAGFACAVYPIWLSGLLASTPKFCWHEAFGKDGVVFDQKQKLLHLRIFRYLDGAEPHWLWNTARVYRNVLGNCATLLVPSCCCVSSALHVHTDFMLTWCEYLLKESSHLPFSRTTTKSNTEKYSWLMNFTFVNKTIGRSLGGVVVLHFMATTNCILPEISTT